MHYFLLLAIFFVHYNARYKSNNTNILLIIGGGTMVKRNYNKMWQIMF